MSQRVLQHTDFRPSSPFEGRCTRMTFRNWIDLLRAAAQRQEGQTMAEYGVVLAVITLGVVVALTALSGGITGAINSVVSKL